MRPYNHILKIMLLCMLNFITPLFFLNWMAVKCKLVCGSDARRITVCTLVFSTRVSCLGFLFLPNEWGYSKILLKNPTKFTISGQRSDIKYKVFISRMFSDITLNCFDKHERYAWYFSSNLLVQISIVFTSIIVSRTHCDKQIMHYSFGKNI